MVKYRYNQRAFTIIELLVIIVVIGILALVLYVSYVNVDKKTKEVSIKSDLKNSTQILSIQKTKYGNFPETIDCSVPDSSINYCIKTSGNNNLSYMTEDIVGGTKGYVLTISNGDLIFRVRENGTVNGPWYKGSTGSVLDGKYVMATDLSTEFTYKTSATPLIAPQGAVITDTGGNSIMSLVSPRKNPDVDFSEYPAQLACAAVGGRLPTHDELSEIYNNKTTNYGSNFEDDIYWTATQNDYTTTQSLAINFDNGVGLAGSKTSSADVRCVSD